MLGVVEHDQQLQRRGCGGQRAAQVTAREGQLQCRGYGGGDEGGVGQRREVDPGAAMGAPVALDRQQVLRQQRLADAADAGDREQAVLVDLVAQGREVAITADQLRQLPGRATRQRRRRRRRRADLVVQRQREAVAPARHGRDGLGPEQLAQRPHVNLEVVLLDDHVGPDTIDQFALGQRAVAMLDQRQQHVEGAGTELGRHAVDQQLALHGLERVAPEPVVARGGVQGVR